MSRFGLCGKIIAHSGQRDTLIAVLLEAAALLRNDPDCELYLVNARQQSLTQYG